MREAVHLAMVPIDAVAVARVDTRRVTGHSDPDFRAWNAGSWSGKRLKSTAATPMAEQADG
jgi:hypothetical protein